MEFDFNRIKDSICSAGKTVGNKVADVSSATKIKLDIHAKEEYLEKEYMELGRAYYLANQNGEEFSGENYINAISVTKGELEQMRQELQTVQGSNVCPNCGEKQSKKNVFCKNCGTKLQI